MSGPLRRSVSRFGGDSESAQLPAVAGEHHGVPAREGGPEALAELPVDGLGVVGEPLAVGGVGGEQAVRRGGRGLLHVGLLERHQAVQAGAGGEVARHLDGPGVAVGAADDGVRARGRQTLHPGAAALARLGDQGVPEDLLVAAPAQKAERRRGGLGVPAAAARLGAQQARARRRPR